MMPHRSHSSDDERSKGHPQTGLFRWLPCVIKDGADARSSCLILLVTLSLLLNLAVCSVLFTGGINGYGSNGGGAGNGIAAHQPEGASPSPTSRALSAASDADAAAAVAQVASLQSEVQSWKGLHKTVSLNFEQLSKQYNDLTVSHAQVTKRLSEAQATIAAAPAAAASAAPAACLDGAASSKKIQQLEAQLVNCRAQVNQKQSLVDDALAKLERAGGSSAAVSNAEGSCPPCAAGVLDQSRLRPKDLTLSKFDFASHEVEWVCDAAVLRGNDTAEGGSEQIRFCEETPTNEQYFQLTFFDRPGAGSQVAVRKGRPVSPTCVQLPPRDYKFPPKVSSMPVALGEDGVHWPNLRVQKLEDLLVFNRGTPKNLYHFNASFYDYEQEIILDRAAEVIPFGHKIRNMLDVGSGGASLGMLLKRRYDIQVVSTVFADWPYCEYISERGGQICMLLDAMEAMPFAKSSYDVIHSSWVFHALFNHQLRAAYLEQNRLLRPGGYMWIYGGWSLAQVATITHLLVDQLGYTILFQRRNMVDRNKVKHSFDLIPFELEWTAILLKPSRVDEKSCQRLLPKAEA